MERDIKNFDRSIERMVNEQEAAPPFGAWNRISAELDAMPVGESAPSGALIPKRGLTGIIAGAIILGVAVTATYFMNHSLVNNNDKTTALVYTAQKTETTAPATVYTAPATPENAVKTKNSKPSAINKNRHQHAASQIVKNTAAPINPASQSQPVVSMNADVPCAIQSVKSIPNFEVAQAFYFPPVDRNTPEKLGANNAKYDKKIGDDNDDDNDKKVKSGLGEQKIKFRPKKRPKFHYARTNRL